MDGELFSRICKASVGIKLIVYLFLIFCTGMASGYGLSLCGAIGVFIWLLSGETLIEAGRQLKRFAWFFFIMMSVPLVFYPGMPIELFNGYKLPVAYEAVIASLSAGGKLATMFLLSFSFMKTSAVEEVQKTLELFIVKLKMKDSILEEIMKVFFLSWTIFPKLLIYVKKECSLDEDNIIKFKKNPFKKALAIGRLLIPSIVNILKQPERFIPPKKGDIKGG